MYRNEQLMVEIRCDPSGFNPTSFSPCSLSEEKQGQLVREQGQRELVAHRGSKSKPRFVQDWGDLSISLDNVDETPRQEAMKDSGQDVMGEEK